MGLGLFFFKYHNQKCSSKLISWLEQHGPLLHTRWDLERVGLNEVPTEQALDILDVGVGSADASLPGVVHFAGQSDPVVFLERFLGEETGLGRLERFTCRTEIRTQSLDH